MVTLCDDRVDGNHPTPTLLPLHIDLHTARATFGSFDRFAHRTISLLCEEMQMEIEMALATIYHAPYNIKSAGVVPTAFCYDILRKPSI